MEKLFIPILLGTRRQDRQSEKVAKFIFSKTQQHNEIITQLIDPREIIFPYDDEGQSLKSLNPNYRDAIIKADGIIIVCPEYNHGYSGSLKTMLDICLKEYIHKAVAFCGVSAGNFGGARSIEHLVQIVRELGLVATFTDLNFSTVQDLFDEQGNILNASYEHKVEAFLTELVWMSKVLRWGRANLPSKYNQ